MLAERTTSSFSTKNRGAWRRRRRFFLVTTSAEPSPTSVPRPMAQVLIFHAVRFSGMAKETSAQPSASVSIAAAQNAVSANFVRTVGSFMGGAPGSSAFASFFS